MRRTPQAAEEPGSERTMERPGARPRCARCVAPARNSAAAVCAQNSCLITFQAACGWDEYSSWPAVPPPPARGSTPRYPVNNQPPCLAVCYAPLAVHSGMLSSLSSHVRQGGGEQAPCCGRACILQALFRWDPTSACPCASAWRRGTGIHVRCPENARPDQRPGRRLWWQEKRHAKCAAVCSAVFVRRVRRRLQRKTGAAISFFHARSVSAFARNGRVMLTTATA